MNKTIITVLLLVGAPLSNAMFDSLGGGMPSPAKQEEPVTLPYKTFLAMMRHAAKHCQLENVDKLNEADKQDVTKVYRSYCLPRETVVNDAWGTHTEIKRPRYQNPDSEKTGFISV